MKEKIVGVRVEEMLWDAIIKYSKEKEISKSKITRDALKKYLSIYRNPLPMILWSNNEFQFALSCLNETQIEELAKISFKNGTEWKGYFTKEFLGLENMNEFKFNVKNVITLLSLTFSSQGQNWFQKFKSIWRKDSFIIYGAHELGWNFSFYIKSILHNYMEIFQYQIVKEELRENLLIIEYQEIKKSDDLS